MRSTMANFDQMGNLLRAVQDGTPAWKQLLSALNNERKHGCNRCHFKPCDIGVFYVSAMCSLEKKKNDYQMISGTQLCILNIKDTAFFQKLSQQAVIHPIASISHPFYPHILMAIQIWMFRCKRLAVIKCSSKRKLGNWVFLCVSADKNTKG